MTDAAPDVPLGLYRHFKGGAYEVIGLARHSETLSWHVVYRALYGDGGLWVRPATMFLEYVTHNGETVPRFQTFVEPPASAGRV